jgi:hypothetical protein
MGHIIYPNGLSVSNDKVTGSVPYEYLIVDIQSDCLTNEYRAKCLGILTEVGCLFSYKDMMIAYLEFLHNETESEELKKACKELLIKVKPKKTKTKNKKAKSGLD